jgi:hypothetical protein
MEVGECTEAIRKFMSKAEELGEKENTSLPSRG